MMKRGNLDSGGRLGLFVVVSALAGLALGLGNAGCRKANPPPPEVVEGGTGGKAPGTGGTGGSRPTDGNEPNPGEDAKAPVDVAIPCGNPGLACCPGNRCLNGGCCELGICTSFGSVCKLAPGHSCIGSACSKECGGLSNGMPMKCCGAEMNCTFPLTVCDCVGPPAGTCTMCGRRGPALLRGQLLRAWLQLQHGGPVHLEQRRRPIPQRRQLRRPDRQTAGLNPPGPRRLHAVVELHERGGRAGEAQHRDAGWDSRPRRSGCRPPRA